MGCSQSTAAKQVNDPNYPRFAVGQTERLVSRADRLKMNQLPEVHLDEHGKMKPEEVKRRSSSSTTTKKLILGKPDEDIVVEYAFWTQRGYYPDDPHKENQDEIAVTTKYGSDERDAMFAVFDGHGTDGHTCAKYAKQKLPSLVSKHVVALRVAKYKEQIEREGSTETKFYQPAKWPYISPEEYQECCRKGFLECNSNMHKDNSVPDKLSGTTAITVNFHGDIITISNVGDSRAILAHQRPNTDKLLPIPLSRDQTPYRKDERERVKALGASVMSIDQMQGKEEMHDNWGDLVLGQDVDIHGDPPRIWVTGKDYPGTAFTRSIGDTLAEDIGVIAEPETLSTRLTSNDKYLVIASDGIFEFLTNQEVVDICEKSENPLSACEALTRAAYDQWLIHENRTDDISVLVCFLGVKTAPPSDGNIKGTSEELVETAGSYGEKPVRRVARGNRDTLSQVDMSAQEAA